MSDPLAISHNWLNRFITALTEKDIFSLVNLFLPDGWLRDSLVFTWDTRSIQGHEKLHRYLEEHLPRSQFIKESFHLDKRIGLAPSSFTLSDEIQGIQTAFAFETPAFRFRGLTRLINEKDSRRGEQQWKALSVYVALEEIKNYEEAGFELGLYGDHNIRLSWMEVSSKRRAEIEKEPQVLIIGAGQTGLQVAARFKQMNIKTLIIERNERVGDNWRKRYPTLSLNTPKSHHFLLYAPFPRNWPKYAPRDKIAAWLEHYAEVQDLTIWTSTTISEGSQPQYDSLTGLWTVRLSTLSKSGDLPKMHTIHPRHIIIATGTLGNPFISSIPSLASFHGIAFHAADYSQYSPKFDDKTNSFDPGPLANKQVLIVGAGTTAADIAQDLHSLHQRLSPSSLSSNITLLQRSPVCVVSRELADLEFAGWPGDPIPVEVSDFKVAAMPLGLAMNIGRSSSEREKRLRIDGALRAGLEAKGFKTCDGLEIGNGVGGGGRRELVYEKLGGYWIDVGAADLIINGAINIKSGAEIKAFDENGKTVLFTDGSEMDVDAIIFATGYENIRSSIRKLFGSELIDSTSEVWGLDAEGELRGCYRPSGHPGVILWYAAGDFYHSRYMSKQLALQIKAEELGLKSTPNPSSMTQEVPSKRQ